MWNKDIVEWKIRSRGLVWHLTKSFLMGEGLNSNFKTKISKFGDVCVSKLVLLKLITDGGLGRRLFVIFWKKKLF